MKKLIFFATILLASIVFGGRRVAAQTANQPGSGNCLSFVPASNDYIGDIGTTSSFSFVQNTGVFTCESWIKLNSLTDGSPVIVGNTPTTAEKGFVFYLIVSGGLVKLGVEIYRGVGGVYVISSNSTVGVINDTQWHHVAVVGNGTNITFYVDGIAFVGSGTMNAFGTGASSRLLEIGNDYSAAFGSPGTYTFNGQLDEVRIWNRALTQTEIQQNMCRKLPDCASPNLLGYWRFDEGTDNTCSGGQDACDASCNGNHGVKN